MAKITIEEGDKKYEIYTVGTTLSLENNGYSMFPYRTVTIRGRIDDQGPDPGIVMTEVY